MELLLLRSLKQNGCGGDDSRKGPLADFVAGNERKEGSVDLGQANGSWSQGRQRSRLSKTIRVRISLEKVSPQ